IIRLFLQIVNRPGPSPVKNKPVYKHYSQAENKKKIEINSPAYQHGRDQVSAGKNMGKHGLVHQFCYALGAGKRQHIYSKIYGSLKEKCLQGTGTGLPEPQIYHMSQHKYTAAV